LLCLDKTRRGTFGNIAASLANQPLPFAADMQDGEITEANRRFLDWKAAVFEMREPRGVSTCFSLGRKYA
jgi:hypothetical protein